MFKLIAIFLAPLCISVCTTNAAPSKATDVLDNVGNAITNEFHYIENKTVEMWNEVTTRVLDACSCVDYNCGCCAHLEEKEIHLNSTICMNISYLVHDYGISLTVTVNGYAIFNETVSARNPPPICLGVPYVKEYADLCIRLYDIDATSTHLHACVKAEARMKMIVIAKYEFGCFNIGPPGVATTEPPSILQRSSEIVTSSTVVMVTGIVTGLLIITVLLVFITWKRRRGILVYGLNYGQLHKNYGSAETLIRGRNVNC